MPVCPLDLPSPRRNVNGVKNGGGWEGEEADFSLSHSLVPFLSELTQARLPVLLGDRHQLQEGDLASAFLGCAPHRRGQAALLCVIWDLVCLLAELTIQLEKYFQKQKN